MEQAGRERLKAACAGRVLFDEPLARHTSMGVGGPADVMVFPADLDDLVRCLRCLNEAGLPVTPVGNGTNLICRDGGVRGAIVVLKDLQDLRLDRETGERPPASGTHPGPPGVEILPGRESGDPGDAPDSGRRGNGVGTQGADGTARESRRETREPAAERMSPPRPDAVEVTAGAGVALQALVALALKEALAGAEFLAGIPGSVGGAVRMNAGAYGRELSDILTAVVWLSRTGELRQTPREALTFSYRRTDLPAEAMIAAARFALHPGEAGAIRRAVDETLALRRAKHPLAQRNAGSIFKNPRPTPAGRLIEAAGLKGTRVGQAMVSEMHANFIVNLGGATAADVIALMDLIRARVRAHAGVDLEPEVRIIGEK
ncbi:MAG TPA: UDP-N-acetylmuramate dehydrogenase [Syntrophales bacterium]|nr:UDP-N-acetylmuramate dehydrogenase [Syntrophales bacterium]